MSLCLHERESGGRLDASKVKGSEGRVPSDRSSLWIVSLRFESAARSDCDFFSSSRSSVSDRSFGLMDRVEADLRLNKETIRPLQLRKSGGDYWGCVAAGGEDGGKSRFIPSRLVAFAPSVGCTTTQSSELDSSLVHYTLPRGHPTLSFRCWWESSASRSVYRSRSERRTTSQHSRRFLEEGSLQRWRRSFSFRRDCRSCFPFLGE